MSCDKLAVSRNAGKCGEGTESSDGTEQNVPPAKRSRLEMDPTSVLEDFPVHLRNPFKKAFCGSDVVLVVEGKKLHAHKQILTLNCAYFRTLYGSQNFAEASANEIELKDSEFLKVKYDPMVRFLRFLYPVHCADTIRLDGDETLSDLLPLADYFQCQHVRGRCEEYLKRQLDSVGSSYNKDHTNISADRALLYLLLCSKYRTDKFVERLLAILARKELADVDCNEHFKSLTPEVQSNVVYRRAQFLEQRLDSQPKEVAAYFKKVTNGDYTCSACDRKQSRCYTLCTDCQYKLQRNLKL